MVSNAEEYKKMKDMLVEQKLTTQITINAGITDRVEIDIPAGKTIFLKGYGHSYYDDNEFTLSTGNAQFPMRTDQEGSPSIPIVYGVPFKCRSGGKLKLTIKNGDTSNHTYDVVFYILTNDFLDYASTGGELILATDAGSGGVATSVKIFNSSGTDIDSTNPLKVNDSPPNAIVAGTNITVAAAALILAATTALHKGLTIVADEANTDYTLIGNASAQEVKLYPGDSMFIEIDDIAKIFFKRPGGSDVRLNYIGG